MTHTISDEVFKQLPKEVQDLICPPKVEEWEPPGGDYRVLSNGTVINDQSLELVSIFGMERTTEALAERLRDDLWLYLRMHAYRDQYAPDYESDWSNDNVGS